MSLEEYIIKISSSKDKLLGFASEMFSKKEETPQIYEDFCKAAFSALGEEELIEGFLNSFNSEEIIKIASKGISKYAALRLIKEVALIDAIKNLPLSKSSSIGYLVEGSAARLGKATQSLNPKKYGPAGPPKVLMNNVGTSVKLR